MFRKKRSIKAELVLDIAVKEVKRDTQYEGRIDGCGVPLKFAVTFIIPFSMLDFYIEAGELFQIPAQKIVGVLNQTLKNRYDLKIVREEGKSIDVPPEELDALLFQPIAMAIGLLQRKIGVSEATFHIPCLVAEEMDQFRNPTELQEYVLSLNR